MASLVQPQWLKHLNVISSIRFEFTCTNAFIVTIQKDWQVFSEPTLLISFFRRHVLTPRREEPGPFLRYRPFCHAYIESKEWFCGHLHECPISKLFDSSFILYLFYYIGHFLSGQSSRLFRERDAFSLGQFLCILSKLITFLVCSRIKLLLNLL